MTNLEIKEESLDLSDLRGVSLQVEKLKDEILSMNKWEVGPKGGSSKERNSDEKVEQTTKFLANVFKGRQRGLDAVSQGLDTLLREKNTTISLKDKERVAKLLKDIKDECVTNGNVDEKKLKQFVSTNFKDRDFFVFDSLMNAMPRPPR